MPIDTLFESEELEQLEAIEEVVLIGYPAGIRDPAHLTPIARKGITATPPAWDYGGRPTFLVDASVFHGSSGSPVFSRDIDATRPSWKLLGVVSGGKAQPQRVQVPSYRGQ